MAPPPGYIAYGGHGSVNLGVQKIGGLIKAIVILLIILVPLQIIGIFSSLALIDKANKFLESDGATSFDTSQNSLSSLSILVIIPIAVLTMIVMFKMANNLKALGRGGATWAAGWAVGGWFVPPIVLYVVPWLMFRELWRGSDPEVGPGDPNWKQAPVSPLVNVWWVLYGLLPLASIFTVGSMFSQLSKGGDAERVVAQELSDHGTFSTVLAVVAIGTTIVYLVMLRQLGARHMKATREA